MVVHVLRDVAQEYRCEDAANSKARAAVVYVLVCSCVRHLALEHDLFPPSGLRSDASTRSSRYYRRELV
ncbi:unnamed protein product [Zymoseptoria tritici ST99CH_3D7]|uniref:Uncharacterized protein n=1 Tax=Zymoseptoria tritici (strain ST99CH_3D7) TaxID=1276538 RepID=A0A1X7RE12_ZYMT9|nr:unnamed protein product [Zymoseptoria tritici ST99CH_3D7]